MVSPVPDQPTVDTPYGRRGPYWSCHRDSHGNGIHTGADFAAPAGARVVAARPGRLEHVDYGSAFGAHQLVVVTDGSRDFYAHLRSRRDPGPVQAGDKLGEVGAEGNATGPHLHFERHTTTTGGWSCQIVTDPTPSIEWEEQMSEDDWTRLEDLVRHVVWGEQMTLTQPGTGQDTTKSRQQVLRELWQKVTRVT